MRSGRGPPAFDSPAKHFHAVGQVRFGRGVHALAIARAAQMGQPGSGNQAARRLRGMVNGRQNAPVRAPEVDGIIFQRSPVALWRASSLSFIPLLIAAFASS